MATAMNGKETLIPAFYFDPAQLDALADRLSDEYRNAKPYPHIVVDNFLPVPVAERLLEEFPAPSHIRWLNKTHEHSKKLASNDLTQMGPFTRHVFGEFNCSVFVRFLEKLTGIAGLIPDPHFIGGGLHQIKRGGRLDVHADFNRYTQLNLDRRLNALIYLNKGWDDSYGGHLELWNRNMTRCEKKVLPLFNRLVVFSTTDFSYHGHADPLNCPENRTRKSLALYYYTNGRPAEEITEAHDTLYQRRPGDKTRINLVAALKKLVPPIIKELLHK